MKSDNIISLEESRKRDCTYCGSRGFVYINGDMFKQVSCRYCNGTGKLKVLEKRKSILVSVETHYALTELAKDHRYTLKEFMDYVVKDYKSRTVIDTGDR